MIWTIIRDFYLLAGSYVMITSATKAYYDGTLTLFWKVILVPWGIIGVLLDSLFMGLFLGSIFFLELPRFHKIKGIPYPELFTWKLERHMTEDGLRGKQARWWCRQLSVFQKDHCHANRVEGPST